MRLQDIRRHLDFFCFLSAPNSLLGAGRAEWAKIRTMVDDLPTGKSVQVGMTFTSCGWQSATTTTRTSETSLSWLSHFAHTVLQLPHVAAAVYGRGVGHIPANKGYTSGLLMWWKGPQGHIMFEEMISGSASSHLSSLSMRTRHPNVWMEIRFVLCLVQDET